VRLAIWPMNVVPVGPEQTQPAISALAERCGWQDPITSEVERELIDWFEVGWSADAILVALDRKPDNSRQNSRTVREDLYTYIRERLRAWYDDSSDADSSTTRLTPPRQGQSFEQWWLIRHMNHQRVAPRKPRSLSESGKRARSAAMDESRRFSSGDRVARVREADTRRRAVLDSIAPPSATQYNPLSDLAQMIKQATEVDSRSKLTATYAGRRAVIAHHSRVRTVISRVTSEHRAPTAAELQILRNGIREARTTGATAQLEAWTAGSGGVLSSEGMRILTYLDNALNDNLPFDSLVALITTMVEQTDTFW
jgi:hypothetical protein